MPAENFGRYQLLHKLATGGMGEVWLARQRGPAGFDRFIAVKRLLPSLAASSEFVQMFQDEARLVSRLTHPNICQIHEFGVETETQAHYLAMEYLHGETLSSVLERSIEEGKPLSQGLIAFIVAQALDGLHSAHEAKDELGVPFQLVHRDVSPSNIFITYDGHVKLLDFGIAKAAHRNTQTVAGSIKGKFSYIAPEVYQGNAIDRRVDLFAMGVVLWELLTQRRLYKRATEYEACRAIVEEQPPDPRDFDAAIAPELAQAALQGLSKTPGGRFQTALEMRRAVSGFLRSLPSETDSHQLGEVMTELYGRVWIDLRSSVLESFKAGVGPVAHAEVLDGTRPTASALSTDTTAAHEPRAPHARGSRVALPLPPARGSADERQSRAAWSTAAWTFSATAALALISVIGFASLHRAARPDPPPGSGVAVVEPLPQPVPSPPAPSPIPAGAVLVTAAPQTASVQLDDGDDRGPSATFRGLVPGTHHHLLIQAAGYEPRTIEFDSPAGESLVDVSLLRKAAPRPSRPASAASGRRQERTINPDQPIDPWKH